jgi:L-amino acid N-acyltransferase
MIHVRVATIDDLPVITDIYNDAVRNTPSTFETTPKSLEDRRAWFELHGAAFPVIVAEESGRILGWASLSRLGSRPGWRFTAEDSIYVHADARSRGVGRALLLRLVDDARRLGYHTIVARIVADNEPSIRLHRSIGFEIVGTWHEVGRKFDRWLDLVNMQLIFEPGAPLNEKPAQENPPAPKP